MAYDRLLERLYLVDNDWIVKGATALLARDLAVRATIDVDVYRQASSREIAEAELREAAGRDIGDWFTFEIGERRTLSEAADGFRLPVKAFIGTAAWAAFHVDLGGDELHVTGEPEAVPALARVVVPDVEQHGYLVYPLVDHVADKVAAMFELYGVDGAPSTRYKDLVDVVAITIAASLPAELQITAIQSEATHRGLRLPERFTVPDLQLWGRGYAREAGRSLLPIARTLDEALAVVSPCLDPLLDGTARGNWDPEQRRWVKSSLTE
ncbi:MAG TPA: nucleotidyl transferase AbiEii/AbiGii toxin family protein [Tepidiformaceae bacterium]